MSREMEIGLLIGQVEAVTKDVLLILFDKSVKTNARVYNEITNVITNVEDAASLGHITLTQARYVCGMLVDLRCTVTE